MGKYLILKVPKFLIVAATRPEVQPILKRFDISVTDEEGLFKNHSLNPELSVLLTGVGMVNTAFNLGKYLISDYRYVINAGICGAFNRNINIGEVVNITSDTLSEMGAEDNTQFIKYNDLNLGGTNCFENSTEINYEPLNNLKKVKGITVNKVHGNDESIKKVISLFDPEVESMEGAAFFKAFQNSKTNYFQIRAVSNYVEKRDKSKWNIPIAINNINEFVIKLIQNI